MSAQKLQDRLVGVRLGDYTIQELLGRGGMARVYRGLDEKLGRAAAVKVLQITSDSATDDDRSVDRFKLEARAIANFDHPNIVSVYQYGETDDFFFIAMKLVEGKTLAQILRRARRNRTLLPAQQILKIVRDICAGLDYAHARNIIHRDIKPSNILFDAESDDRAIITDFGLAMRLGGDSTLGTAFGTPRYISPEQAVSSLQAVPQSDIYSLGVIVFEMLTGQVPFQDESPMSIALYHITSEPPRPRSLNPDIPPSVEAVVLKALAKEPDDRYPTASDFYRALEAAYQEAGVVPSSAPASEPAPEATPMPEAEPETPAFAKPVIGPSVAFPDRRQQQADAAAKPEKQRKKLGLLPRVVMMLVVVLGIFGFWLLNGQSLVLPAAITDAMSGMVGGLARSIGIGGGRSSSAVAAPSEYRFDLIYDDVSLTLRNRNNSAVTIEDLVLAWGDGSSRFTYSGEDFTGSIPAGQCSWLRLLSEGTVGPPPECPSTAYYLRMISDPGDLFWVRQETFRIIVDGEEVQTCTFSAGRCSFVILH